MPTPKDKRVYDLARNMVYLQYNKPSAYRSGALVKKYKQLYREKYGDDDAYEGKKELTGLTRWYKEDWKDVNPYKTMYSYPVYRPTKIITKDTPSTEREIPLQRLIDQARLKQIIKGKYNLPQF